MADNDVDLPLVETHLGLVRGLARKIRRTLPAQFDVDDLISEGAIGLLDAATRFDPDRGIPFARFASARIYGAILDYVRAEAPLSRHAYRAVVAGTSDRHVHLEPLDDVHLATLADYAPTPEAVASQHSTARRVRAAIAVLPPRERAIVIGRYFQHRVHTDLAHELGVNPSRVSELEARARRKLRAALRGETLVTRKPGRPKGAPLTPWQRELQRHRQDRAQHARVPPRHETPGGSPPVNADGHQCWGVGMGTRRDRRRDGTFLPTGHRDATSARTS